LRKGAGCALRQLKYSIKLGILLAAGRIEVQIRAGRWGETIGFLVRIFWKVQKRVGGPVGVEWDSAHVSFIPDEDRETTGCNYR